MRCSPLLVVVLALACFHKANAATYTEEFHTLSSDVWNSVTYNGPGPFTIEAVDGRLLLKKESVDGGGGVRGGGIASRFQLVGDFAITVEFEWDIYPENNQIQINIGVPGVGFLYDMGNGKGVDVSAGQIIYYNFIPSDGTIQPGARVLTDDTKGALRLVRSGATFSAFFRSPGDAEFTSIPRSLNLTAEPVVFSLILQNNFIDNISSVFYDNLVVTAESFIGMPETVGVEDGVVQVGELGVSPNPVGCCTDLVFDLPKEGRVEVSLIDIAGRVLLEEAAGVHSAGPGTIPLQLPTSLRSGVYFVVLRSGSFSTRTRMHVIR